MEFHGEKLKIARLYRNLSISDFAKMIDVSRQSITLFEKDEITPKGETIFKIVKGLDFPIKFFTENIEKKLVIENTFFRSLSSAKVLDLSTSETKTTLIIRYYNFLSQYLNLPELNMPNMDTENKSIEQIALETRNYWGLSDKPISNMLNVLESNGVIISSIETNTENIDAFTQVHKIDGEYKYCIVFNNDKCSMVRRNFDAAHELGHIILHKGYPNVKELTREEFKFMEQEANAFAASFLLPKSSFFIDLKTPTNIHSYIDLKRKWKVSISAMIMRAKALNRITHSDYSKLFKTMSYRGWRKKEPLDDIFLINKPSLFNIAINMLIENDKITVENLLLELQNVGLAINADELESLLSLDKGLLNKPSNTPNMRPVISLLD